MQFNISGITNYKLKKQNTENASFIVAFLCGSTMCFTWTTILTGCKDLFDGQPRQYYLFVFYQVMIE